VDARDIGAKQSFVASPGYDGEDALRADLPLTACDQRQHRTRKVVITGLVPVIHVLGLSRRKDVDGRDT
jgi:hypothetical protein